MAEKDLTFPYNPAQNLAREAPKASGSTISLEGPILTSDLEEKGGVG